MRILEKPPNAGVNFFRRLLSYPKRKPFRTIFIFLTVFSLVSIVSFVGYIYHYVFYDRSNLPDIKILADFNPPTVGTVYDEEGRTIINLAKEFRWISKSEDVPDVVRYAILSAEDKNFYEHNGVDWTAFFFRAGIRNLVHVGENIYHNERPYVEAQQGASTLDQQLVRLIFLRDIVHQEGASPINKFKRKFEEWRLAIWINEELQKPEYFGSKEKAKEHILTCILNYAYFRGVYGIKAASLFYFNKDIKDLQYEEAALLAGIMKNPLSYAPSSKKALKATDLSRQKQLNRRNSVLDLMVANKYLEKELANKLKEAELPLPSPANIKIRTEAPSAVGNVFEEIKSENFDVSKIFNGELQVYTTINLDIQKIANEALENGLKAYEGRFPKEEGKIQGSVVVLRNSDGAVLAQVGGRQVYKSKKIAYNDFNRTKHSIRQPGSAFKPFVYLTALQNGWTLESEIRDAPIAVPMGSVKVGNKWVSRPPKWIKNYDGKFKGFIPLRKSLAESRNAPTMRLATVVGIEEVIKTAYLLGIRTKLQPYITTAIGASDVNLLELANAYRAIASGVYAEPYSVKKLTDNRGQTVFTPENKTYLLEIDTLALEQLQEGLRGVVRIPSGTAHSLDNADFPIPVMGKTGTTNDFRDALFVGSTYGIGGITIAVRIGFDDYHQLGDKETGGRTALPVFREIMLNVYKGNLAGHVPQFPEHIERNIDNYLKP